MRCKIEFEYDHATGFYYAYLENGTCIPVDRSHIQGRLANTLRLFAKAVIEANSGRWQQTKVKPTFTYSYEDRAIRRFDKRGNLIEDLDFNMDDIDV